MSQTSIFDFIGEIPEIGKNYSMLFPIKFGMRGATATVVKVEQDNCKAYCDIVSNIGGQRRWEYSIILSFNEFYEAVERMDQLLNRAKRSV
ncbi:hypothetical protein H7K13_23865 [Priestia aryabhattai]|uniref:hypothetical protein n=1 Tax=Priestia aryabhattai TaxID=412384 RepID=UPI001C8EA55F|nr:hypothetical protein [Priestia aryabhattai]MBY0077967.1 hypothetical protein [Priestia aryabhattai]